MDVIVLGETLHGVSTTVKGASHQQALRIHVVKYTKNRNVVKIQLRLR